MTDPATKGTRGFTLLEMLVALSVMSIAALALLRLDGYAVRTAGDLDARTLAQIVVQNRAAELLTDPQPPTIGNAVQSVTNGGLSWRVAQRVQPTADPSLLRIDLSAESPGNPVRAGLTLIRPAG